MSETLYEELRRITRQRVVRAEASMAEYEEAISELRLEVSDANRILEMLEVLCPEQSDDQLSLKATILAVLADNPSGLVRAQIDELVKGRLANPVSASTMNTTLWRLKTQTKEIVGGKGVPFQLRSILEAGRS